MPKLEKEEVYKKSIKLNGDNQLFYLSEKMSGLNKEIMKCLQKRGELKRVQKELVDLEIQIEIAKIFFPDPDFEKKKQEEIDGLYYRLTQEMI